MNLPTTTTKRPASRIVPRLFAPAVSALALAGVLLLAGWSSAPAFAAPAAHAGAKRTVTKAQSASQSSQTTVVVTSTPPSPAVIAAMQTSNPQSMVAALVTPSAYSLDKVDRVLWSIGEPVAGLPNSEWQQTGMGPLVVTPNVPAALREILHHGYGQHGQAVDLSALPNVLRAIPHNTIVVVAGYSTAQANTAVAEVRSRYSTVPVLELYIPQSWPQKYATDAVEVTVSNLMNYN